MEENEMIEETVEMETPEEIYETDELDIIEADSEDSIAPVIALGGVIVGGVAAIAVAAKKTHFLGRVKSAASAAKSAFTGYEVPEEETTEGETETYVEVKSTEDSAE